MQTNQPLSIVIPTLNEIDNVPAILARIDATLSPASIPYEVVIIDDHSIDGTKELADTLTDKYPLSVHTKHGKRGKAYSLLEGFDKARYGLIVMIDADLQYPPEAIRPMYELMAETKADVVVTNRYDKNVSVIRKLSTKIFNLIFARLLFGIKFDTQSGLKLFRKDILNSFTMTPSPWSFDLEFLVRALENRYTIVSHDIHFAERSFGDTKVRLLQTTFELAKASVQLRWRTSSSRVRAGYRANNRFIEKALQIVVLASLLALGNAALAPAHTAAASLAVNQPLQKTTASVISNLPVVGNGGNNPVTVTGNNPTKQTTTTPTSSDQSTNGTATNDQTTATNGANSAANTATTAAATKTTAAKTVAAVPDQSSLMPATGTQANNVYSSTYPYYKLSASTTNQLFTAGQLVTLAGLVCLVAAIIINGMRATRIVKTAVLTRN